MAVDTRKLLRDRLDPGQRFGLRLTLFAVALIIVVVPFYGLLDEVLEKEELVAFDGRTANALNDWSYRRGWVRPILEGLAQAGRPVPLAVLVIAAVIVCLRNGRRRSAIFLVVTSASAGVVNTIVKVLVDRPRPVVDHEIITAFGNSFPSGHAMGSTATYGALLVVFAPRVHGRLRWGSICAVTFLVLAIGASRALSGVHFVSDVVAGHLLGLAWLAGATATAQVWLEESGSPGLGEDGDAVGGPDSQ